MSASIHLFGVPGQELDEAQQLLRKRGFSVEVRLILAATKQELEKLVDLPYVYTDTGALYAGRDRIRKLAEEISA